MSEPLWVDTASNHAVITREELMGWLQVKKTELKAMIREQGFPPPRFRGTGDIDTITSRSRWRVGDVRAWLTNPARVAREMRIEIGAERSAANRGPRLAGFDPMGRRTK